jgi:hypothetical protein
MPYACLAPRGEARAEPRPTIWKGKKDVKVMNFVNPPGGTGTADFRHLSSLKRPETFKKTVHS